MSDDDVTDDDEIRADILACTHPTNEWTGVELDRWHHDDGPEGALRFRADCHACRGVLTFVVTPDMARPMWKWMRAGVRPDGHENAPADPDGAAHLEAARAGLYAVLAYGKRIGDDTIVQRATNMQLLLTANADPDHRPYFGYDDPDLDLDLDLDPAEGDE